MFVYQRNVFWWYVTLWLSCVRIVNKPCIVMQTNLKYVFGFLILLVNYTACHPTPKRGRVPYKIIADAPFSEKDSHFQLRNRLVYQAAQQIGSRYRSGKQCRADGFDCSGLIFYTFQKSDIKTARIARQLAKDAKRIPVKSAKPGDLLFFGYKGSIGHVGMVSNNDTSGVSMIHASVSKGVIQENITKQKYWMSRFQFAGDMIATCYGKPAAKLPKTEKPSKKTTKPVAKPDKTPATASIPTERMGKKAHQGRPEKQNVDPSAHNSTNIVVQRGGFFKHQGRMML
jgi:murein DD-endopeptidase / murein LD-carboxypeptidase